MPHQLEVWVVQQVQDVVFDTSKEIVQTDDIVAIIQQALAKVGAKKACTTGDEGAGTMGVVFH